MPEASSPPTVARVQLGRELRSLRRAARLEPGAVTARLECSASKLSKIERGLAVPRSLELRELIALYQVSPEGAERLRNLLTAARQRSRYPVADHIRAYLFMEAGADEIHTYQTEVVPGLLQTEAYAEAVIRAADPARNLNEVARLVGARLDRQSRLRGESGPRVWAVLNEAVAWRQVGGPSAMAAQLRHLVELAEDYERVTIQVLPFSAGAHAAAGCSFAWIHQQDDDDGGAAQAIFLEDYNGAVYHDRPSVVAEYRRLFASATAAALSPDDSIQLIRVLAEDMAQGK